MSAMENLPVPPDPSVAARLRPWGLILKKEHPEIPLDGSPERALARSVVEDDQGRLFILERIAPEHRERKIAIARKLEALHARGLEQINPYRPADGNLLVPLEGDWWQLQPFLASEKIDRETYAEEAWRGRAMADFLRKLAGATAAFPAEAPFSLPVYGRRIGRLLEEQQPRAYRDLADVWDYLQQGLFARYDKLPVAFTHGDFHPLNILWEPGGIRAVIDWEFCGFKPELYDAALLAGCVGFDAPEYLTRPMLRTFLKDLCAGGFGQPASWKSFVDLVLAIRIGWLREWLVKNDKEALEQEVVYMQLLRDNIGLLESRWEIV
jgi:homoserine kinase type II